jgi:hypothetical protein
MQEKEHRCEESAVTEEKIAVKTFLAEFYHEEVT